MPTSFSHTPKYRRQSFKKKRGQAKRADIAFVELNGERRYLGVYGSPESREAYDRIIAEYLAHGRELKKPEALAGCTVATIAAAFLKWAENEYKKPDGTLSARFDDMKYAIKPLITLYASLPAEEFGPMKLEAVRKAIIVERLARKTINERISIIKRMFGWAVTQELISAEAAMKLKFLKGLALAHGAPDKHRMGIAGKEFAGLSAFDRRMVRGRRNHDRNPETGSVQVAAKSNMS